MYEFEVCDEPFIAWQTLDFNIRFFNKFDIFTLTAVYLN